MIGDEKVRRQLRRLDERVRKKVLKSTARKALKPAVQAYKRNITDADEVFAVYRNGSIYAEIKPGQLKRSIGIKFPKQEPGVDGIVASVGPRRTGRYADPEKGGWYAGFISFGWLTFKNGEKYKGRNFGYADRAIKLGERLAAPRIKRVFTELVRAEIKKLGFTQKAGLR